MFSQLKRDLKEGCKWLTVNTFIIWARNRLCWGFSVRSSAFRLEQKMQLQKLEIGFQEKIIDFTWINLLKTSRFRKVWYIRLHLIWKNIWDLCRQNFRHIIYNCIKTNIDFMSASKRCVWINVYTFCRALRTYSMFNLSPQPLFPFTFIEKIWALVCANVFVFLFA